MNKFEPSLEMIKTADARLKANQKARSIEARRIRKQGNTSEFVCMGYLISKERIGCHSAVTVFNSAGVKVGDVVGSIGEAIDYIRSIKQSTKQG
jgi:hypothetical protein